MPRVRVLAAARGGFARVAPMIPGLPRTVGVVLVLAGVVGGAAASAQEARPRMTAPGTPPNKPTCDRPAFAILRQDEDWSCLKDPNIRPDPLDRFKYVPLNGDGSISLSLAVDGYLSVRAFDNAGRGASLGFDDTYNIRLNTHLAISFGDRVRLYGALKHGDQHRKSGPVAPPERDPLDVHQAFAEVTFGDVFGGAPNDAFVRIGRQELHYGDGRLISARVGPNVRSDFDGLLVRARIGPATTDAFIFRGVTDGPKVFDNGRDEGNNIWGVYSTLAGRELNLDLLYLGQDRAVSAYAFTPESFAETRHTVGFRLWTSGRSGWRLGLGAEYQVGNARPVMGQDLAIGAWAVGGAASYAAKDSRLAPTFGVEIGWTAGDNDPLDDRLGTFRALAPPGRYTGVADGFGPGNLAGIRPLVDLHPTGKLRVRPKATVFWRVREEDGLYSVPATVISGPADGDRFAGFEPGLEIEYKFDPHWAVTGALSHFFVGAGIGTTSLRKDVTYVEATISFKM